MQNSIFLLKNKKIMKEQVTLHSKLEVKIYSWNPIILVLNYQLLINSKISEKIFILNKCHPFFWNVIYIILSIFKKINYHQKKHLNDANYISINEFKFFIKN